MIKAGTALKIIFPNITHLTCHAHALHRANFPFADRLVSYVKKAFVRAPYRKEVFKAASPNVPLPLEPILTR
jgi:hypothetical protein